MHDLLARRILHGANVRKVLCCMPQTWSNLADTLVAAAELLAEAGDAAAAGQEPGRLYAEAMAAYAAACGLSSSEAGDDLPTLLFNWAVGLHSLGTHAPVRPQLRRAMGLHSELEALCCLSSTGAGCS